MTLFKRFMAVVLCLCLLLTLFGCGQAPVPAETADGQTLTALDTYAKARADVDNASDLRLQISITKTTIVGGQVFNQETKQVLTKTQDEAGAPIWMSEETVTYDDAYVTTYDEIYTDGTLYVTYGDEYHYSSQMTPEEYAQRIVPAVLLDASLYGEITQEGNALIFGQATAGESWAMPEGAELVEATGTAQLDESGKLQRTIYSLVYNYGPAEITLQVQSYVSLEAVTAQYPEDPSAYTMVDHIDALRMSDSAQCYLMTSDTVSLYSLESVMSQAAGFMHNQSRSVNTWGTGKDLLAKVEYSTFMMDATGEQKYEMEELFRDGVYTATEDGGEPQTMSQVTAPMMENYCKEFRTSGLSTYGSLENVTIHDLGSLYLLELTYNEAFGDRMQDTICSTYFGDADLLMDLASDYRNNTLSGYISIDKYTGLPVAAGYHYEGVHTIEGGEYILSFQKDQSIEAPALGAYYEITEEMLPEEEPENKATPLFYRVTGPKGQEMWLFGTIHVGDARTAYLPQEICDALLSSDALALEFYSKAFDEQCEEDEKLQDAISDAYYFNDGTTTADHVDEELYEDALRYLKAVGGYNMNAPYMKPYLWSQQIDNFYLRQGYQLTNDQGVESRLEKIAEDNGIEIRDVESGLFQIQMFTGWSDELQSLLLEDTLETDAMGSWESTMELYELWCAGDEEAMREMLSDEVDTSEFTEEEMAEYEAQKPYIDEYNKSMSYDRNDGMLEVAISYLESGETVFFAVGLAHLLNDYNGLVDALRAAGYTVELVEFAQ